MKSVLQLSVHRFTWSTTSLQYNSYRVLVWVLYVLTDKAEDWSYKVAIYQSMRNSWWTWKHTKHKYIIEWKHKIYNTIQMFQINNKGMFKLKGTKHSPCPISLRNDSGCRTSGYFKSCKTILLFYHNLW